MLGVPSAFTLLWGSSVISQLGSFSVATATPLLALAFGASPVVIGWLVAAGSIPGLLLHLPAGLLVDRIDRWKIMRVSQWIRVVNAVLLAAALGTFKEPTALLIIAALIDGTATVFYNIAEITVVRHIVPHGDLRNAMATNEARQHIALILGRPLGGLLFGLQRIFPYTVGAATSLLSIGTLAWMRKLGSIPDAAATVMPEERERPRVALGVALNQVIHDSFLRATIIACALGNFFFQTIILLLYVTAKDQHLSSSSFGLLLAVSGACGLGGAILAPQVLRKVRPRIVVVCCVWAWLIMITIVAYSGHVTVALVAWGLCTFMGVHLNVALASHQAEHVDSELQGRVAGICRFVTGGTVPLGALGSGYIISGLGLEHAAALAPLPFAAIVAATLVLLRPLTWLRRVRLRPVRGRRQAAAAAQSRP